MKHKILTILTFVFLAFLASVNAQTTYSWKIVGQMPVPVTGGQVVYDLNATTSKIYILGGYSDAQQNSIDLIQEYNVVSNIWTTVAKMNQARYLFVADIWKSNVVYFGGVSTKSLAKNEVESWVFKPNFGLPATYDVQDNFARSFSTGHIKGDTLYIIGGNPIEGSGVTSLPYIVEYSLTNKNVITTFDTGAVDKPQQQMSFIIGNNIYIFGGVSSQSTLLSSIYKFNITTKKLEKLETKLPSVRAGGAAVYNPITNRGYIIGGYNETKYALATVDEISIEPNGSMKINSFPSLNFPRRNPMVVNYGAFIAVFGGRDLEGKVVQFVEILDANLTSVESTIIPENIELFQNYPNPFNPSTNISFQLSSPNFVTVKVFDVLGKEITTLVNEYKSAGKHTVTFSDSRLPGGIYYYKMVAGNYTETKKMVLIK